MFYYDVEKCIRQNESDTELADICLAILYQIKESQSKDDRMQSSLWLPFGHQVMPLSTLFTANKDVFGGSLTSSQEEIMVSGGRYCYSTCYLRHYYRYYHSGCRSSKKHFLDHV